MQCAGVHEVLHCHAHYAVMAPKPATLMHAAVMALVVKCHRKQADAVIQHIAWGLSAHPTAYARRSPVLQGGQQHCFSDKVLQVRLAFKERRPQVLHGDIQQRWPPPGGISDAPAAAAPATEAPPQAQPADGRPALAAAAAAAAHVAQIRCHRIEFRRRRLTLQGCQGAAAAVRAVLRRVPPVGQLAVLHCGICPAAQIANLQQ